MVCDNCKERDAVIQVMQVTEKGQTRLNLCERCAAEQNIETTLSQPKQSLLDHLLPAQKQLAAAVETNRCAFCSSSLRDFKSSGRLGCARCYVSFESTMRDLLRRVHGSSRHVGKQYRATEPRTDQRDVVLRELRERLRRAIEAEQFEVAAELRDRIKVME